MKKRELSGILDQQRLEFRDNAELERYYEAKYGRGGYEGGCLLHGINISQVYHDERHRSALKFLRPAAGEVILDAGCGTGSLSVRIAARCREVRAIDIAGNAFAPAHRAVANVHFRKMNVEALDFPAGTFDAIVSVETLEHLINPAVALAEFHRVLKPGGRLVLTYPTVNRTAMGALQRRLGIGRHLDISEHLNEWNYAEVVAAGRAAGFTFEKSEGLVFDLGAGFSWLRAKVRFLARPITNLSLAIRWFPRNAAFVTVAFRRA
jgi:2-polyprenyl-3-methyl-5-hydroxy-6-metoxy-1,4-benzoquinol methylase